jgi:hypothetical protein
LGKKRFAEGIPLSEVVYVLSLTKHHLLEYIRFSGMIDSAVEMHGAQELQRLAGRFFDKAVYYTVRAFEREADWQDRSSTVMCVA